MMEVVAVTAQLATNSTLPGKVKETTDQKRCGSTDPALEVQCLVL